jgi:hypothetical protein
MKLFRKKQFNQNNKKNMKTYYKVQLFTPSIWLAEVVVLAAARSNADDGCKLTMQELIHLSQMSKKQFPQESESNYYWDGNTFNLDAKIGDEWKTVCIIEEIEVSELTTIDDLKGVL